MGWAKVIGLLVDGALYPALLVDSLEDLHIVPKNEFLRYASKVDNHTLKSDNFNIILRMDVRTFLRFCLKILVIVFLQYVNFRGTQTFFSRSDLNAS